MLSEILIQLQRPDFPNQAELVRGLPKVAWKTGTSYGRRDAWCIGYTPKYTIGVWLGNHSGKPSHKLVGGEVAAPLLLNLFRAVQRDQQAWFKVPQRLQTRAVCRETGNKANSFCKRQTQDYFIPLISPMEACSHLEAVLVSADSSYSFCNHCLPSEGYTQAYYPNYSPELIGFYTSKGVPMEQAPPHWPQCSVASQYASPKILSPKNNYTFYSVVASQEVEVELGCELSPKATWAHWFVDGKYLGRFPAEQKPVASLPKGQVNILCVDDLGAKASVSVNSR